MKHFLSITLIMLIITTNVFADAGKDSPIRFKSVTVTPAGNISDWMMQGEPFTESAVQGKFFRIIQFDRIPTPEERASLMSAGIELMDYLPELAWFVSFSKDFQKTAIASSAIRGIYDILPVYKTDASLYQSRYPAHAIRSGNRIALTLGYWPVLDPETAREAMARAGITVTSADDFGKSAEIEVPVTAIEAVASLPFVMFLEPVSPEPEPENYTGRTLHRSNMLATDYSAGRHYDGTGVHVMLQDDGIIGPHIDYQGRIGAQYMTSNNGDHGDHCAGIIMAAGNLDPRAKGNAPGADIYVYSASGYPGFNAIPNVYNTLGIRVTSTSYGDGCNAGYTSRARTLDQQVRQFAGLMHIFSAGNSGSEDCDYGAGAGWGNITGGHKQGKNVIAVANLNQQDDLASSSSRGPAHDGRIKPDISAKGTDVYSTINPNTYQYSSGTSMACPGVAGSVAQLIQGYRALYNNQDPMAGLLKGVILNAADDLGNPGPDFRFGWGRINAFRAIKTFEEGRFDSGYLINGSSISRPIVVPPNTAQLRVMIYWTDYEAATNAATALVNNLDLTLTDGAMTVWRPWVLSHYPHPDSLNKPAARGIDNLNNMEQITLDDPAAGTYLAEVTGTSIPQGPQTYYLIYEFVPETVTLTYPAGGESWVPGYQELIRWDAFGTSEPFTLLYSSDNGQQWDTIAKNIPGTARSYFWQVAPVQTGYALVRVARGNSYDQCAAPISVIGVPCNLAIDWVCGDQIHLSWNPVPGATGYDVFRLGDKYMAVVGNTSQTSFLLTGNSTTVSNWLTIRALGADSIVGRRAVAIESTPGNLNCHPTDAALHASETAGWGVYYNLMSPDQVKMVVKVKNAGQLPVSNLQLSYRVDNGAVITGTYNGTIQPDSILRFTFAQPVSLAGSGTRTLQTWVSVTGDSNRSNDTLTMPVEMTEGTIMAAGMVQSFESWTKCLSAPICELYSCTLEDGWYNLTNGIQDQHDWRTFSGATPTSGTGPTADHTLGTASGKYLYIEPSVQCLSKAAMLLTPCLDLSGMERPAFTFWYYANGPDIGTLHMDLFDGTHFAEDIMAPVFGHHGAMWKELTVDLSPWAGRRVALRLRGVTSCKDKGDLAIDDAKLSDIPVGISEPWAAGGDEQLNVYPNPASGEVIIQLRSAGDGTAEITAVSLQGQVVFRQIISERTRELRETINLSDLPKGIYVLEVKSNGKTFRKKLVMW